MVSNSILRSRRISPRHPHTDSRASNRGNRRRHSPNFIFLFRCSAALSFIAHQNDARTPAETELKISSGVSVSRLLCSPLFSHLHPPLALRLASFSFSAVNDSFDPGFWWLLFVDAFTLPVFLFPSSSPLDAQHFYLSIFVYSPQQRLLITVCAMLLSSSVRSGVRKAATSRCADGMRVPIF